MEWVQRVPSAGLSAFYVAVLVTTSLLAGCGQTPSFTEQASTPIATAYDGDDATAGTNEEGDSTNGGLAGVNPNDPVDGYQPGMIPPGSETPDNLMLVQDHSLLETISKVDILWIVDSSGSMAEEQTYLGNNFRSFMTQLQASNADFQTGVTTTDICANGSPSTVPMSERYCPISSGTSATHLRGSLVGDSGKKVLNPNTPNLMNRFLNYANVGIQGSGFEHGLKAAEMAVAKSLAGQNEGLVRDNSFLAIVVVSDEEDDGIGLGMVDGYGTPNYIANGMTSFRYTEDNLIQYLTANKGAGMYSVSAITGTRNANGSLCRSSHSQPNEEGTQYIAAARKTGGIIQSICETNWSASLATMGRDIAAQSSQIVLTKIPYNGTIRVYVNGVENFQWTYSSGTNSIKFNTGYVPAAGADVNVSYWSAQ